MSVPWLTMLHIITADTDAQAKSKLDHMMQFLNISALGVKGDHVQVMSASISVILEDYRLWKANLGLEGLR